MRILIILLSLSSAIRALLTDGYGSIPWKQTDIITGELGPYLSPGASIVLPSGNATLFFELTKRYAVVHPDVTAVVRVGLGDDVPIIIKYAKRKGRSILAGSGRHGWATMLNRVNDAIMIDISALTQISIDASSNTMVVGGGVRIGNVTATLQEAGKEAATGICDCIGLLGATLGGGHGRLQGLHGLMVDNLISVQLATAAGGLITVSNTSYPDLFWGIRGAGHNFGIVTEAVYRIYNQTNGGQQFSANVAYSADQIEVLFTAMDEFQVPAETSALVVFIPQASALPIINLNFISSAPTATALSQLDTAFGHIPYLSRVDSLIPWASANGLGLLGNGQTACTGTGRRDSSGVSMRYYNTGAIRKAYESFVDFTTSSAASTSLMIFESYSVKGVQAVPAVDTAYPHREEKAIALLSAGYLDASLDVKAQSWIENVTSILHASSGFERPAVYMNYAQGTEGFGAMYGYEEWREMRLKKLKRRYDPGCTFSWYQPIPIPCS